MENPIDVKVRLTEEQADLLRDRTRGKSALLDQLGIPHDAKIELLEYSVPLAGSKKKAESLLVRITHPPD